VIEGSTIAPPLPGGLFDYARSHANATAPSHEAAARITERLTVLQLRFLHMLSVAGEGGLTKREAGKRYRLQDFFDGRPMPETYAAESTAAARLSELANAFCPPMAVVSGKRDGCGIYRITERGRELVK
jgi:hypothetical protein